MTPQEARRQAMIALGGIEGVRDRSHAQRPGIGLAILLQDLRYALRQMRRSPGFALGVIAVLALGIGANAAMFTVLEGTLFRPLPYADFGKLVQLRALGTKGVAIEKHLADLLVWRERTHKLSQIAYYGGIEAYLRSANSEQKVMAVHGSANLFATLGVNPVLGRGFTDDEQQPGEENVAVLSNSVWRVQFHADPSILGHSVLVDDVPTTVIGVMPAGFAFPAENGAAQIWQPVAIKPVDLTRSYAAAFYEFIGRRKPSESPADVTTELSQIQKSLLPLYTDNNGPVRVEATDYRRSLNANDQRTALFALLAAVAVLWLIACANVASLMLARTAARRREMAVRSALGASRWRLIRQMLVESLLLSGLGGAVGLLLSDVTLRLFRHSLTTQFGANLSLHPDARVLFALLVLSIFSALVFGVVPSQIVSSIAVDQALRQDNEQAGASRHQNRMQGILVVGELALTLVMLVACSLLLRTVFALKRVPLGFRTDHVFVIDPQVPYYKYAKRDTNAVIYKPLLERLKTIPGIQYAALTTIAPLDKNFDLSFTLYMDDKANDVIHAVLRASGPEYQRVLGFNMVQGRFFDAEDTPNSQHVAVVNRTFLKAYSSTGSDISKFGFGAAKTDPKRRFKIIGVMDDFHQVGIADESKPEIDMDASQLTPRDSFYQPALQTHVQIALRSTRDARSLVPELDRVLREFNPDLAGSDIRTMNQIVEDSMGSQLLAAHLLEALGGLALLVTLAGLYSLLAYLVTLRTRELGLRLALGAQRTDILTLVLRSAGTLLVAGAMIGIVISLLTAHLLHSFLFGVGEYDLLTLIAAPLLLLCVGILASWQPARRAALLEPMQALRAE
jgi:predicted permease